MPDPLAQILLPRDRFAHYEPRIATISSTKPVEVSILDQDGLPVGGVNAGYTPALDDIVLILQSDADIILVCQIVSGG